MLLVPTGPLLSRSTGSSSCATRRKSPLFFAEPSAETAWDHRLYSYLLGDELLVAPVVEPGADTRRVWLPEGDWVHLWSGDRFAGGWTEVPAQLGQPPVFYRAGAAFTALFEELK